MKKIKIIPTTDDASLCFNIEKSSLYVPTWYKNSKQKINGYEKYSLVPENPMITTSTYKKCSPFLDALTDGYIFYLSQDIEVMVQSDGSPYILWRTHLHTPISTHSNNQWEGFPVPEEYHNFLYKWENSFIIKTPKKYSTLFTHPHNRFDLPFRTLSGIVDTDSFNLQVKFPFIIKKNFTGIIKAGTPLAQLTFIKRDGWFKVKSKYNEDFIKKESFKFFSNIERSYKKLHWQKKEYN